MVEQGQVTGCRLAVDFGSTHTVAMLAEPGREPRGLLFDGSPLLPSAVFAAPDGRLHTGVDALRLSAVDPAAFEPYPKTHIDEPAVLLGAREVPVPDLFAAVLSRVSEEARRAAAGPVGECVLTHPAAWGARRRAVLAEGARRAGLTSLTGPGTTGLVLMPEPLAAARYFAGVLGQRFPVGQRLAVFDFGGGTLDVAVIACTRDGFDVVGLGGLDDVGGRDLDAAAVAQVGAAVGARDPMAWQRLAAPATPDAQHDRILLWQEVRQAKEMLSRAAVAPVHVPGYPVGVHLTREEFERVAAPLVDRAVSEAVRVLTTTGTTAGVLAGVFLVGGASRVPMVAQRLHRRLGIAPTVLEQPETVVAAGAVHQPRPAPPAPVAPVSPVPGAPMSPALVPVAPMSPAPGPVAPGGSPGLSVAAPGAVRAGHVRRRWRVALAAAVAVLVAAAVTIVVIANRGGAPSNDPLTDGAASSAGVPAVAASSVPESLRELAGPWLPLVTSCANPQPAWFADFNAAEPRAVIHCTVRRTTDTEWVRVEAVSFFSFASATAAERLHSNLARTGSKSIEPPSGSGLGTVWQIGSRSRNISIIPAACVIYWDRGSPGAGAVLMSTGEEACQDRVQSFWTARVTATG